MFESSNGMIVLGKRAWSSALKRLTTSGGFAFIPDHRYSANALHDALRGRAALRGVEDHQLSHSADVVTGHNPHKSGGMIRYGRRKEDRVGPIPPTAVELLLACAIRIHREQKARPDVRNVRNQGTIDTGLC